MSAIASQVTGLDAERIMYRSMPIKRALREIQARILSGEKPGKFGLDGFSWSIANGALWRHERNDDGGRIRGRRNGGDVRIGEVSRK